MPRPHRAQGRPGTRVIPVDWNESHAQVVERAMRGTCLIRRPGTTQEWSDAEDQMVAVPHAPYFSGACRVQALRGEARVVHTAGDREVVADYLITVPLPVDVAEQDLVEVTAGDAALTAPLQVLHVARGTERFERDLYCTLTT